MRASPFVIISTTLLAFAYLSIDAQAAEDYKDLKLCQLVFSDQDLERYEKSEDAPTEPAVPGNEYEKRQRINKEERDRAMEEKKRISEEKQKDHWCNRGSKIRRKIERLKLNVQDRERKIAVMNTITFREMAEKRRLRKTLKRDVRDDSRKQNNP